MRQWERIFGWCGKRHDRGFGGYWEGGRDMIGGLEDIGRVEET